MACCSLVRDKRLPLDSESFVTKLIISVSKDTRPWVQARPVPPSATSKRTAKRWARYTASLALVTPVM